MDLLKSVRIKIDSVGVEEAAKLFGVSIGTVSNWKSGKTTPSLAAAQLMVNEEQQIPLTDLIPDIEDFHKEPQAEVVTWEGKKVQMLIPVYRQFCADTHYSLFANYAKYGPEKIGMEIRKGTVIHEARNILIHNWINHSDSPTAIMPDDDMILPTGNPAYINGVCGGNIPVKMASEVAISRIMSHGTDKGIVGALYFGRHSAGRAQCSSGFTGEIENRKLHEFKYDGLKTEDWIGTGFIKIERWVIEKYKAAIDAGEFPECKPQAAGRWYGYFNPIGVGIGEDVSFGTRCKKLGIQSYLDCGLICLHEGPMAYGPKNTNNYQRTI